MLPSKRYRLLACVVVMAAVLGAGVVSWVRWGVPEYSHYGHMTTPNGISPPREPNALWVLWWETPKP